MEHKGEVAKLRRIIHKCDEILLLAKTEPDVSPVNAQSLQQLRQSILIAQMIATNMTIGSKTTTFSYKPRKGKKHAPQPD
jgi:hypothetical protein